MTPLHRDLIERVCRANPGALARGFFTGLTEVLLAESGDFTDGDWRLYTSSRTDAVGAFRGAKRYLRSHAGACIPDVWCVPNASMSVVVWEVCVRTKLEAAEDKWSAFACELDHYDEWSVSVITVDARGVSLCRDRRGSLHTWPVDAPCPIDFCDGVRFTDRGDTTISSRRTLERMVAA